MEFVLVVALVIAVAGLLLQVALALLVRNTAIWCAAEGARAGARWGAPAGAAVRRTSTLIEETLRPEYARSVSSTRQRVNGLVIVEVSVTTPVPLVGLIGPADMLTVRARALAEDQG